VLSEVSLQPLAQAADLRLVFVGLVLRQIDALGREADDVGVINMVSAHALDF
jgi:hypothetical protein